MLRRDPDTGRQRRDGGIAAPRRLHAATIGIIGKRAGLWHQSETRPGLRRSLGCGEILFLSAMWPGTCEAIACDQPDARILCVRRLFVRERTMTIHENADLLILGAGFAGSLMALVARRIGLRPVVVEKGRHPRFAIGESSTPVANLVLEELAHTYDLPRLHPLTKYGRWQATYPHLACGLKRGFTFIRHESGRPFAPNADHSNELLVAASPRDEIGDTHWFREHFDHFIVEQVRSAEIPYYDQTEIVALEHRNGWSVRGQRLGQAVQVEADFLIDATGPSGLLPRT